MADNVTLSAGTNDGAVMRTLETADGVEYAVSSLAYATTLSDGENVLVDVTPTNRLPVQSVQSGTWVIDAVVGPIVCNNDTPGDLLATVYLAEDQTVAATQSGDWSVGVAGSVTVAQDTAANLKATVDIASGQTLDAVTTVGTVTNPVEVVQDTAGDLLCTASQGGSWTVAATQSGGWNVGISGTPTVKIDAEQSVAATQSGTWEVDIASGQTLANVTTVGSITNPVAVTQSGDWSFDLASVEVTQDTAASLLCTASQGGDWNVGITGTAAVTQSGTWNVGTVTAVTAVGTITNPVGLKAGTALIGKTAAGADTSTIYSGTTALTPKFAKIEATASGQTTVVDGVTGKKIRVLRMGYTASAATSVKWQSASTDLTGSETMVAGAKGGASYCEVGVIETAAGEDLNISLSATATVGGMLTYVEVA